MQTALLALFWVATIAVPMLGVYGGWRFVRAYERRGTERGELEALREKVKQLEEDADSTSTQLAALADENRFLTRLLDRPAGHDAPG